MDIDERPNTVQWLKSCLQALHTCEKGDTVRNIKFLGNEYNII